MAPGAVSKIDLSYLLNNDEFTPAFKKFAQPAASRTIKTSRSQRPAVRGGARKSRPRRFICETCEFAFYTNSDLQKVCWTFHNLAVYRGTDMMQWCWLFPCFQHISSVHLQLRPYGCTMCDRTFGEKSNATKQYVPQILMLSPVTF